MKAKPTAAPSKSAPKHQRLKIASIPVLLVVLAYVMFAPADEPGSDNVPLDNVAVGSPVAAIASTTQPVAGANAQANRPAAARAWPEASLRFLGTPNPFKSLVPEPAQPADQRLVATKVQPTIQDVDQLADVASELQRRPVNFVFRSAKQNVIMLGDAVLEKGTHLSPAVQLHEIQDHAVLLKLHP